MNILDLKINMEEEIIKIKRQHLREVIVILKMTMILGDKSYATRVEKNMLKDIENKADNLLESLNHPYKKE
jgi:hypothetical protein